MKDVFERVKQFIKPINGLILFLVLSFLVVTLWKLFNLDNLLHDFLFPVNRKLILFESPINYFIVSKILSIGSTFKIDTIIFNNGYSLIEDPLCTGLKQIVQFSIIMIFYPGPIKNKLWYIQAPG